MADPLQNGVLLIQRTWVGVCFGEFEHVSRAFPHPKAAPMGQSPFLPNKDHIYYV